VNRLQTAPVDMHEPPLREEPRDSDRAAIRRIVAGTGFFSPPEVDVAVELVDERLAKGRSSGYEFVFLEDGPDLIGYACYGEIPCTVGSYDLYWVAVDSARQGQGLGKRLVRAVEERVTDRAGRKIYIETSSRPLYDATRVFYQRCGYREAAVFADFYAPGDARVVYEKTLRS
jgi:ribosomal protein S18 acetylase RimI-like enzyme